MKLKKFVLNGINPQHFLKHYWQKKPLLIRNAIPNFENLLSPKQLFKLSLSEETESRLIIRNGKKWQLHHGPFHSRDFKRPSSSHWTLLVQGLNYLLPSAEELLLRFNFIPYTRLDDVMVSLAIPGAGVGPHFDSYDVFLLQGKGRRRWRIAKHYNPTLVASAPIKLLKHFSAEKEMVLYPGDILYLPPQYAHDGIALDECMTYSIGFRSPSTQELATQFLIYLQDHLQTSGQYADPDLSMQSNAAQISNAMLSQVTQMLKQIQWNKNTILDFLGCYLTESKSHIFFKRPNKALAKKRFLKLSQSKGLKLCPKTKLLFKGNYFYLNGECVRFSKDVIPTMKKLAHQRYIASLSKLSSLDQNIIYDGYRHGFIELGTP